MSVIEKAEELEAFFHNAGKTRDRWRVGTEYEKVGIDRIRAKPFPIPDRGASSSFCGS